MMSNELYCFGSLLRVNLLFLCFDVCLCYYVVIDCCACFGLLCGCVMLRWAGGISGVLELVDIDWLTDIHSLARAQTVMQHKLSTRVFVVCDLC